jgi:hypothetical protein
MRNLAIVTSHLRTALAARGAKDAARRCLRLVPARGDHTHHVDPAGDAWRCFDFIERTHTRDVAESSRPAEEAARAFGAFVAACSDLDPDRLAETIPGFHDLAGRVAALERAIAADRVGRAARVAAEIEASASAQSRVATLLATAGAARLPPRVVHNDCKLNNVLFDDATDEALCVIDLDTVMPGSVLCDFGDLVRTAACTAAEDSRDLAAVRFDRELFRALARGYQVGIGDLLSRGERDLLALAGPAAALENAVRFLTDHLEGDVYFRVEREGHNLDRFRVQQRLLDKMLDTLDTAHEIVRTTAPR